MVSQTMHGDAAISSVMEPPTIREGRRQHETIVMLYQYLLSSKTEYSIEPLGAKWRLHHHSFMRCCVASARKLPRGWKCWWVTVIFWHFLLPRLDSTRSTGKPQSVFYFSASMSNDWKTPKRPPRRVTLKLLLLLSTVLLAAFETCYITNTTLHLFTSWNSLLYCCFLQKAFKLLFFLIGIFTSAL